MPVGGEGTHCVLSGHRGLPSAKLFSDIDQLKIGDRFKVRVLGRTLHYEVDQIRVVLPEEMDELEIQEGEDYMTLLTCTPYGVNTHRLLVRGQRTSGDSKEDGSRTGGIAKTGDSSQIMLFFLLSLAAIMTFSVLIIYKRNKNRRR